MGGETSGSKSPSSRGSSAVDDEMGVEGVAPKRVLPLCQAGEQRLNPVSSLLPAPAHSHSCNLCPPKSELTIGALLRLLCAGTEIYLSVAEVGQGQK